MPATPDSILVPGSQSTPDLWAIFLRLVESTGPIGLSMAFILVCMIIGVRWFIKPLGNEYIRVEQIRLELAAKELDRATITERITATMERIASTQLKTAQLTQGSQS